MPKSKLNPIALQQASLQDYVRHLVDHAVASVFKINHTPSVVRQTRKVVTGKIDYIDYAAPCFHLGIILKKKPQDVARGLAERINTESLSNRVKAEQVGGYLNLQISTGLVEEFARHAKYLLEENNGVKRPTKSKGKFYSFMFVSAQHAGFAEVGSLALSLIEEARSKAGLDGASIVFTDTEISKQRGGRTSKTKYVQFTGYVKKTNELINEISKKRPNANCRILSDKHTKAVYVVIDGENAYALRSANGRLCDAAFLLYALSLVPAHEGPLFEKGVIIAPQVLHDQIRDLSKLLLASGRKNISNEQPYTYFDPMVSRADIAAIKKYSSSVDVIMKEVSLTIGRLEQHHLTNRLQRQRALALIDFYDVIRTCIQHQSFPMLFDTLNGALHDIERFNEVVRERHG